MNSRSTALSLAIITVTGLTVMTHHHVRGDETKYSGEERAIRQTVDKYFRGVSTADRKLIEASWDVASGHMKHIRPGAKQDRVAVTEIVTAVDWWTRTKAKNASSEVLSVDIVADSMATVKFRFVYDKWDYTEYLTLFKLSGQWKIVNKSYVKKVVEQ